jgi:hypothetical protein
LKNYNEKNPLLGTNPLCNWTFPLHDLWPQNLSINHARGSNRTCLTVTYELMKKTHPAPIFQEHSQRRQDDGQQHINERIGPSGSDRHFCCGTPTWAGEDKKVSCFSKRERESVCVCVSESSKTSCETGSWSMQNYASENSSWMQLIAAEKM